VCMHRCRLKEGQTGRCRARKNENGKSVPVNYGKVTSVALDPIEKKPLARFYPGSMVLSVGSFGCNLSCPFCQNCGISTVGDGGIPTEFISPEELAALAKKLEARGNIGAAYTYNEPMVGYEYVRDASIEIKQLGMKNVVVTNGSVSTEALGEVLPYVDAYNIDLKCFTEAGYRALGGDLETVKAFIRAAADRAHVELTTLIVPGFNDDKNEMAALSAWVASVDRKIPLHITRFFPRYKMADKSPTNVAVLHGLADVAKKQLDTVLLGNV
jgi:pyruvate formate lyase activating enzyme